MRTRDPLVAVFWGKDGSLALRYRGRIERVVDGRVRDRARIPASVRDRPGHVLLGHLRRRSSPPASSDHVGLDICGGQGIVGRARASAAVWSPDSRWVALATETGIQILPVEGPPEEATRLAGPGAGPRLAGVRR